jgi:hypothetical protein
MLAATCFSTFDVCSKYISTTLASDEDVSIAIHCAVIVHDNTPPASPIAANPRYLTQMIGRHRRLLHYLEPIFSQSLPGSEAKLLHEDAFDHALARLWLGYRPVIAGAFHRVGMRFLGPILGGSHVSPRETMTYITTY